MRIAADYHTHTIFSHGHGTMEDNVRAALQKGLRAIAITDHGTGHWLYGVRQRRMGAMLEEAARLKQAYAGRIEILLGLEGNLCSLDGATDLPEQKGPYDILLLGYHRAVRMHWRDALWFSVRNGPFAFERSREYRALENANAMARALRRYPVDIVTHPGMYIPMDIATLARAAAEQGTALEINASHPAFTADQVRLARQNGARFVINSDAHRPERVGDFEQALAVAREAGLTAADVINAGE